MADILSHIKTLYEAMERDYDSVARHYSFTCEGCAENCCTQRFFHYTWAEYFYLLEGMRNAEKFLAGQIIQRAREVVNAYGKEQDPLAPEPLMCPVNFDGLCSLYAHRPMICRMHGLPHRVRDPGGRETRGGGCARMEAMEIKVTWSVNRTPHYTALAQVEGQLRKQRMLSGNLRLTTAEMIVMMKDRDGLLSETDTD